jgi:hypothetical protein
MAQRHHKEQEVLEVIGFFLNFLAFTLNSVAFLLTPVKERWINGVFAYLCLMAQGVYLTYWFGLWQHLTK